MLFFVKYTKGLLNDFPSTHHGYGFLFIAPLKGTVFAIQQHPHPPIFHRIRGTPASFPRQSTPGLFSNMYLTGSSLLNLYNGLIFKI